MRLIALGVVLLGLAGCSGTSVTPPSTFIVFFNANSSVLTPEANKTIDQAATAIKHVRPSTIAIAAGNGSGNNLKLAEPRYRIVRQALEAKGVSSAVIAEASLPSEGAQVTESGNQRVEILLGLTSLTR
jgi:outer membrane protein OmpA-like peptidoglycan-associated protein